MKLRIVSHFVFAVTISTLVAALFGNIPGNTHIVQAKANPASANMAQQYGALPMSFIANAGQVDPAVRFQVRSSGGTLSFENDGVALTLNPSPLGRGTSQATLSALPSAYPSHLDGRPMLPSPLGEGPGVRASVAIRLTFEGANPNTHLGGADQLPGIANFFIGNDPSLWHTNVPTYGGVIYHDLYPGVDLQYGGHPGLLKGTYTLAAGVDPSLIRWRYGGADGVTLNSSTGDLTIHAPDDVTLTEQAPIAWQIRADGTQTPVTVGYAVNSDGSVQFAPAAYDRALPLVIDPGLVYSTYLGGGSFGTGITVDAGGDVYATGYTNATTFPSTPGAYQTASSGNGTDDAYVTKLNANGSALIYSTYLGGPGEDEAYAIAIDPIGDAYITGITYGGGFPTTSGAVQTTSQGAFISKLSPLGNDLVYSAIIGGSGTYADSGNAIAIDPNGNAYITGKTSNINFPITSGVLQTAYGGASNALCNNLIRPEACGDAFVTKLNATGSAFIYSTYLGGNQDDTGNGIQVDSNGNVYVTGYTRSTNFPTTLGVFQTSNNSGSYKIYVSKLNSTGSALLYSTYLGGSGMDLGYHIAIDGSGNAYVVGFSQSNDYPTTPGAFLTGPIQSGYIDSVVVSKLNSAGTALIYSTYLTGPNFSVPIASVPGTIAIDANGDAFITGYTNSIPITSQAFQNTPGSGQNAFLSVLNPSGSTLLYSTYLGGSGVSAGEGIAVDSIQNVYLTGESTASFPTTTGAFQTGYGGGVASAFISKLSLPPSPDALRQDTIGIFRSGTFYLRLHNTTGFADITVNFNYASKPYPVVGDWTNAHFDTVGIYDQSNGLFVLCKANDTLACTNPANILAFAFGDPGDIPLSGRWQANATNFGVGVFRPSNGLIYLKNGLNTGYADNTLVLGVPGDMGLADDWYGDGIDHLGVYRPSNQIFYLTNQVTAGSIADDQFQYGIPGDTPIVGDWLGQGYDGHDGVGLFRQSNGFTYLRNSLTTGYADITFVYGIAGDVPVAGHWQLTYPLQPVRNPGGVLVSPTAVPVPTVSSPGDGLSD